MSDFKVFTRDQMTNDFYHDPNAWTAEYVSGSSLAEVFQSCPAAWKFRPRDDKAKPLVFGTQSHTNFESAELFKSIYRRAPSEDDYKDLITSQTALAAKLKSFGLKGTSGKTYPDLIKMMVDCGEDLNVWWLIEMIAESEARADGVELVPPKDYDACLAMRAVLEKIPEHAASMNSPTAQRELSIFGVINGVKVKVRLDHVDIVHNVTVREIVGTKPDGTPEYEEKFYPTAIVITDYKTTQSANPKEFARHAFNYGYYLKMALQRDLFKAAYPEEKRPIIVRLLAQEKKEPYLPIAFRMSQAQLKIGRIQYMQVIHTFAICQKTNQWHSYELGAPEVELETPAWVLKEYSQYL